VENAVNKKVLIIEDAKDLLMLYKTFLRTANCDIVTATTATDALTLLETEKPDLIVMDLTFPDMSTADFYEKISDKPELDAISKILVSGRDDLATWVDLFNADKGLRKPVLKDEFCTAVSKSLQAVK
jgi:response regulator RpfG family c-di-GMP phosphodiesterase